MDGVDDNIARNGMVGVNIDSTLDIDHSNVGLQNIISESRNNHDGVETRIQLLQGIASRVNERRRLTRSNQHAPVRSDASMVQNTGLGEADETASGVDLEKNVQRAGRGFKRSHSELVAKALKDNSVGLSFYDCNICWKMARDPVLTCCGHLFCWACFYQLDYVDIDTKECPACRGAVMDADVTPIYGSASGSNVADSETAMRIPPRPRARRSDPDAGHI